MTSSTEEYWWLIGAISFCLFLICLVPFVVILCQNRKQNHINNVNVVCQKRTLRTEIDLIKVKPLSTTSAVSRIEYFSRA